MKKCKLIAASAIVSFSLLSTQVSATAAVKPPPRAEAQVEQSFSDWFFSLFDF